MSGSLGEQGSAPHGPARHLPLCQGVNVLFTDRAGGASTGPFRTLNLSDRVGDDPSDVASNRGRVLQAIAPGAHRLAWMHQVHGAGVVFVSGSRQPLADGRPGEVSPEADAAYTDSPGVALGVLAADCAPVLVADPAARIVGAAHAGRPGMAAGVVPALIAAMAAAGAVVGRMQVIIGPSICGRCYEVPARMRAEVAAAVPESACTTRAGTPGIDVRAGLHGQLSGLGVASVADDLRCTAESAELFSYRRDGKTGRVAGLIWLGQ